MLFSIFFQYGAGGGGRRGAHYAKRRTDGRRKALKFVGTGRLPRKLIRCDETSILSRDLVQIIHVCTCLSFSDP